MKNGVDDLNQLPRSSGWLALLFGSLLLSKS